MQGSSYLACLYIGVTSFCDVFQGCDESFDILQRMHFGNTEQGTLPEFRILSGQILAADNAVFALEGLVYGRDREIEPV
jgi:hypothetical protein